MQFEAESPNFRKDGRREIRRLFSFVLLPVEAGSFPLTSRTAPGTGLEDRDTRRAAIPPPPQFPGGIWRFI